MLRIVLKAYKHAGMQQLQRRVFAVVRCMLKQGKTQLARLRFIISVLTPSKCQQEDFQHWLLDGALFWNFKQVIERWKFCVSRCEKKLKDKLDDEIKFAGLEALVLEELEMHLILNSNRL